MARHLAWIAVYVACFLLLAAAIGVLEFSPSRTQAPPPAHEVKPTPAPQSLGRYRIENVA